MVVNSEIATSGFSFFEMMKENEIASSCFALLAKAERFCETVVTKASMKALQLSRVNQKQF
jgi:hypothetical protein